MYPTKFRTKTVFPHRYSKIFYDYWWSHTAFWNALLERLKIEKDVMILVTGDTGCQPKGSKVLMANGSWKNIEEIKVGDEVLSPQKDGSYKFSSVKWTNKFFCPEVYDVVQKNKQKVKLYSCSDNHKIPFYYKYSKRKTKDGKRYYEKMWWDFKEFEASKISNNYQDALGHKIVGFSAMPIPYYKGQKDCKVDAYTLGVILGDGYFGTQLSITTMDEEIINKVKEKYAVMSTHHKKGNKAKGYHFSKKSILYKELMKLRLHNKKSGTKFIPKEALLSSITYRKELLAGLIDTDGYFKKGGYEFTLKSKKLIEDIRDLVYSIGGRCGEIRTIEKRINKINFKGKYYHLSFYIGDMKLPVMLKRKKRDTPCFYKEPNRVAIKTIRNGVNGQTVYGFELDSDSHWYITDNWMVTKNSGKSHLTGNFCLKHARNTKNFVKDDDSVMFEPDKNFIIDPEEFAYKMIQSEGEVLWGDEFRRGSSRRNWYSPINKAIIDRKNTNRKLFNIYFLCLPYEREFDPNLASHLTIWLWVRRGVAEVYVKTSGLKGGTGLNIQKILDREEKYLKENPRKTIINPAIHPEYCGRIAFTKLTAGLKREYDKLVKDKKATGDLTDEEKKKYGIKVERKPEQIVSDVIDDIKQGKIQDKKGVWNALQEIKDTDDKKLKTLNFYLKLEGWGTFDKLFKKDKLQSKDIW